MVRLSARDKMEMQASGVRFGCHVDLAPDEEPDGCVIDDDDRGSCVYGSRHKTREGCPHWRAIEKPGAARDVNWKGVPKTTIGFAALDAKGQIIPNSVRSTRAEVRLCAGECTPVPVRISFKEEEDA